MLVVQDPSGKNRPAPSAAGRPPSEGVVPQRGVQDGEGLAAVHQSLLQAERRRPPVFRVLEKAAGVEG